MKHTGKKHNTGRADNSSRDSQLVPSYKIDPGVASAELKKLAAWTEENSRGIENLQRSADAWWNMMISGSEVVRRFIADRGGILYGGTAIDLALRLVGEHIYPDDEAPDLDFYISDNVDAAYSLADVFHADGNKMARAINAIHVKTMKVDVSGGAFVADISFCPDRVFEEIPYLMSATSPSTKIVHPVFQRVDMHSALALPYDGAPLEVIFHRWYKDLCRFNKLAAAYPTESIRTDWFSETQLAPTTTVSADIITPNSEGRRGSYPLCGWAALACMTAGWLETGGSSSSLKVAKPAVFSGESTIAFDTTRAGIEVITDEPIPNTTQYEPYFTHAHGRFEGSFGGRPVIWWYPEGRLVTITSVKIESADHTSAQITCVSAQFLLYYFLGLFFQYRVVDPKLAATHLAAYEDLLMMTNSSDNLPEFLTLAAQAYGRHNETIGTKVLINRLMHDIRGEQLFVTPVNYYPERARNGHPKFDPDRSHLFRETGREII